MMCLLLVALEMVLSRCSASSSEYHVTARSLACERTRSQHKKRSTKSRENIGSGSKLPKDAPRGEIETSILNCLHGLGPVKTFQKHIPIKALAKYELSGHLHESGLVIGRTNKHSLPKYLSSQAKHIKASRFRSIISSWLQSDRRCPYSMTMGSSYLRSRPGFSNRLPFEDPH